MIKLVCPTCGVEIVHIDLTPVSPPEVESRWRVVFCGAGHSTTMRMRFVGLDVLPYENAKPPRAAPPDPSAVLSALDEGARQEAWEAFDHDHITDGMLEAARQAIRRVDGVLEITTDALGAAIEAALATAPPHRAPDSTSGPDLVGLVEGLKTAFGTGSCACQPCSFHYEAVRSAALDRAAQEKGK